MSTAHLRRFAPQGVLERRRSAAAENGGYDRAVTPRPVGGARWCPVVPLPPGLLPLPAGFELAVAPITAAS
ncbi:hypothetical protein [Streptomyces sp. M41(2017)]|uniref:hypothetical protein n=1 Tax=unclassified Streptomyces TaxID=2593676 RepID=UPI0009C167F1|nr:hypothetical protein [Streptomyces sp. M41(2017)]OQQ17009.1 hypothetical protein B0675_07525 [Streptomyces sp. M41(2017)]